jgi:hypothetical protein
MTQKDRTVGGCWGDAGEIPVMFQSEKCRTRPPLFEADDNQDFGAKSQVRGFGDSYVFNDPNKRKSR